MDERELLTTPDPYQESIRVVWHDPTSYDPGRHAPPYLTKLSSAQRGTLPRINPKVARRFTDEKTPLTSLLAVLRAAAFLHQTHHWQTSGHQYYGDHLLFERLYNESQTFIDQVAERAVGSEGESSVNPLQQVDLVGQLVKMVAVGSTPSEMVTVSLRLEKLVLETIALTLAQLKNNGALSNGTDNLLQGAADLHETFLYLLQQRAKPGAYSYGR